MKKFLFLTPLAVLALSSCSDNEFLGDEHAQHIAKGETPISFTSGAAWLTRADHTGSAAATLLNNNFVVEGIKGDGVIANQVEVFDHYNVNWTENSKNTTESNTADWEYVGIGRHGLSAASNQTIKYWDFAVKQYDFVGFSYGKSDYTKAVLTEIDYSKLGAAVTSGTPVYTVTGNAAELAKTYISDLVTKYNRDGVSEFGSEVQLRFRSLGTKVRVAFYETVPGYSVKNLKFYNTAWDGTTTSTAGVANATLFAANAIFPSETSKGTMSVYYPTVGWANSANGTLSPDYNQAHVKFAAGSESSDALVKTLSFAAVGNLVAKEDSEKGDDNVFIGRTSATASYAGDKAAADHAYKVVLPLGTSDNLQIRIEYDLVPTDGAAETIHVRDARAVVPAAYADWKPNYAYTYIFKISDNTNGWTGVDGDGNVVEGLTPITFDAVVVDTEDGIQETITTIATPSITTYQEGVAVTAGSEYKAGNIYSAVMNSDATPVTLTTSNCCYYEVTAGVTLANETIIQDMLNGSKSNTGITLASKGVTILDAIPGADTADGNDLTVAGKVAKLEVFSGKTYVFNYSDGSKNHVKVIKVQ